MITYVVRTEYQIGGNAESRASGISSAFGSIASAAGKAGAAFDGLVAKAAQLGMVAASLGAAGGIAAIKTGLVDVNASAESAQIGFANLFNTLGATNSFEAGLGAAAQLMKGIRSDAAVLPGEFQEFVGVAQTLTPALLNAGAGLKEIRKMTSLVAVAGAGMSNLGGGLGQASREVSELLMGRAGTHNTFGMNLGIGTHTMIGSKKFNEATMAERMAYVQEKLAKGHESLNAYARSWAGVTSTFSDGVKMLLGRATQPLFERVKDQLFRINELMGGQGFESAADRVGLALAHAFDWAVEATKKIGAHWQEIRATIETVGHALARAYHMIEPLIQKLAEHPGTALGMALGARVGMGAVSVLPQIVSGLEALGAAAGPAAVGLLAIAGAADLLVKDKSDAKDKPEEWMIDTAHRWADETKKIYGKLWSDVKEAGRNLWTALEPLAEGLGLLLIGAVNGVGLALDALVNTINWAANAISWVGRKTGALSTEDGEGWLDKVTRADSKLFGNTAKALGDIASDAANMAAWNAQKATADKQYELDAASLLKKVDASRGAGKANVNVTVQNTILDQADPERLAMSISHSIVRLAKNPQTALGFPTFQHA